MLYILSMTLTREMDVKIWTIKYTFELKGQGLFLTIWEVGGAFLPVRRPDAVDRA